MYALSTKHNTDYIHLIARTYFGLRLPSHPSHLHLPPSTHGQYLVLQERISIFFFSFSSYSSHFPLFRRESYYLWISTFCMHSISLHKIHLELHVLLHPHIKNIQLNHHNHFLHSSSLLVFVTLTSSHPVPSIHSSMLFLRTCFTSPAPSMFPLANK